MYTIWITPHAQGQLPSLSRLVYRQVCIQISQLRQDPRPSHSLEILNIDSDGRRIYVMTNYRVIYEIYDGEKIIIVLDIRCKSDPADEG
ncbi:MAG: type II toxin-antitoxin system RelE/ParE family toxin [Komarekiella atlantica HA4396-MV6]|jgi:mRNA-degrading endonuclease RelE of RelBE toxin-antitoxin system|nr:type II toxin-antitoxin system RelE/ParE family toxin [Komarekiella atlantica HA4396-MV6]